MILQGRLLTDPFEVPPLGWVRVGQGRILDIGLGNSPQQPLAGDEDTLICPGFIDAHLHLSQIDSIGFEGLELLDWLEQVIYPAEMRWTDRSFAEAMATDAHKRMLRSGTIGYAGYLTSHLNAAVALLKASHQIPLRAIAGQVLMDRNATGELLGHELSRLAKSERGRVELSVNPRFAICCSDELLDIAKEKAASRDNTFIQTHLAETKNECDTVTELFPNDANYTEVYNRHGLLTDRTLLAHCLHLDEKQWELIAEKNCVVVHCPTANIFLNSGVFDIKAAKSHGVRLALGSDIAAGTEFAMPLVAKSMIETAKMRAIDIDPDAYIPSPAEAWEMITRGNANALGWSDSGRIEVGAFADLLLLKLPFEMDEQLIEQLINTWDDKYVNDRVLNGKLVVDKDSANTNA